MSHYQYVPARTNHLLHFLLSCLTFGLWVPVWITLAIYNHNRTVPKLLPAAPVSFHPSGQVPMPYANVHLEPPRGTHVTPTRPPLPQGYYSIGVADGQDLSPRQQGPVREESGRRGRVSEERWPE